MPFTELVDGRANDDDADDDRRRVIIIAPLEPLAQVSYE